MEKYIGKAIGYFRELQSLTQTDLGKLTNLKQSNISAYENGRRLPNDENLETILKVLGITLDQLHDKAREFKELAASTLDSQIDEILAIESKINKRKETILRMNPAAIELSDDVILSIKTRVHDLRYEVEQLSEKRLPGPHDRRQSTVEAIVEKAVRQMLDDYSEELACRISEELARTNNSIETIINNLKIK